MAKTRGRPGRAWASMAVAAMIVGGCSLTLESVHRADSASNADRTQMHADGASDTVDSAIDAPTLDLGSDVPLDAAPDGDLTCGPDRRCAEGFVCCEPTRRCVPAACLSCCMFAQDVGNTDVSVDAPFDVGRDTPGDIPTDLRTDIPLDIARDVFVDAGADAPADAARDVYADVPPDVRPDLIVVDAVITLDDGVGCGLCSPGATCCGGICADTDRDESNCGGCGLVCASSQVCSFGTCRSCLAVERLCSLTSDRCCLPVGMMCTFRCPLGT